MTKPTLDELLCTRPASFTLAHAEARLPTMEVNPEWQAKHDAGELPEGINKMVGSLRTVWPEERFTAEEARWVLAMREHLSWRSLGDFVLGNGNQITGMHLEEAARRAAPAGSVYWLEDLDTTAEALRKLAEYGLWPNAPENTARRAEGFNRCALAAWSLP
jgi:hypothetical protein